MEVGFDKLLKAVTSKNTCKTCAFGMGGQNGGMTNEVGDTFEICKKSFQSHISDLKPAIPNDLFNHKKIEDFKKLSGRDIERLGRLNTPLIKEIGSEYYKPIGWDEAFNRVAAQMKIIQPKRSFFYVSGRASNEAGYILQLFARLFGTSNINNSAYYCHQASGVGITNTLGTGSATLQLADLKEADTIFVIGANPASNHPRYLKQLVNCRRRGGNIIVINPLQERGLIDFILPQSIRSYLGDSKIATEYVQPKVGGDIALFKGMAKWILENGQDVISQSWGQICQDTGLTQIQIERIAQIYSKSKNVVLSWGMGITQHQFGVDNVEYIVNLALLKGQLAKKNSGLLPLRGHSNIQGLGSIGVKPKLQEVVFNNLEQKIKCKLPKDEGLDTLACLQASLNRQIDFAWIQGGNLYCSSPDSIFAERALSQIPYKVFLTNTLNHTHIYGASHEQLILPVLTRDEELQSTTQESMFNYVRLSDGQIKRLDNVRSEVDIIQNIASKIIPKTIFDFEVFKSHNTIRKAIAQTIPGFEKMAQIDETKEEFQIGGRTFYEPKFNTPNGKANFVTRKNPSLPPLLKENQFIMTTVRSEGQYNTIIYEIEDLYRGQTERYVILMNPQDMLKLGVKENSFVTISNGEIALQYFKVKPFEIKQGNVAAYYPEINYIVPAITDPRSHTPIYKSFKVSVIPVDQKNNVQNNTQTVQNIHH